MNGHRLPLSPFQERVLAWIIEHPDCTTREIAAGLSVGFGRVYEVCGTLYSRRLIGRQKGLMQGAAARYHAEAEAAEVTGL